MAEGFEKPPTIQDVAEALGMHKSTVSLALSGKGNVSAATRARVLAAARELGYTPNPLAQRLSQGHENDQVCLFTGDLDVGLSTQKLLGIQQRLGAHGLDVPIYVCADRPEAEVSPQVEQVRQLRKQRPRAILCASHRMEDPVFRELAAYQHEGGLVVSYDTPVPLACDQVLFDREEGAYQAARYLLDRDHRRIGFGISDNPHFHPRAHFDPVQSRLAGFRRALQEADLTMRDEWLFHGPAYERGGAEMAHQFLALDDRPTAVCLVNDYVALAFLVEVRRAGVAVPEDLSVISHDNQPVASYCPVPLTSVTHPVEAIADTAVRLLLERIADVTLPPRTVTLTGELVERESVRGWGGGRREARGCAGDGVAG